MTALSPENMIGMVTGRIASGTTGEITVAIRGGSECFLAFPHDPKDSFEVGAQVVIVEYVPPRTVRVAHWT